MSYRNVGCCLGDNPFIRFSNNNKFIVILNENEKKVYILKVQVYPEEFLKKHSKPIIKNIYRMEFRRLKSFSYPSPSSPR